MPTCLFAQSTAVPTKPTVVVAGTEGVPLAHPATADQIREYMALTGIAKASQDVMAKMLEGMRATSAPYITSSFWDDMSNEFLKLDVVSVFVPIYQRYISEEDMSNVIAFYRSGAGKQLLAVQPLMIRDSQEIMRKKGGDLGAAIYERHKDEIEAAKAKYESGPAIKLPN